MSENQASVCAWAEATFGEVHPQDAFKRCAMEFAELADMMGYQDLAHVIDDYMTHGPDAGFDPAAARVECADVLITLYRVAQEVGCDLDAAVEAKMTVNRARRWVRTGPGIGRHVKVEP